MVTITNFEMTNIKGITNMKKVFRLFSLFAFIALVTASCKKEAGTTDPTPNPIVINPNPSSVLSYGDSIFYLRSTANIISPLPMNSAGKFFGFPKGIELDEATGKINLEESEMGLRYKIMFVPNGTNDTISTKIVLAGINFYDGIYRLSQGDSIAMPIYNAKGIAFTPGQFGTGLNNSFDEGNGCNSQGCAVSVVNGRINLAKSLRDGAIASSHDSQKEFTYFYKMDDASGRSLNKLKIKLYYYQRRADIPQYLWDILLIDHAGTILRESQAQGNGIAESQAIAKPRPPCIVIVDN
jgi:hypothetical protein